MPNKNKYWQVVFWVAHEDDRQRKSFASKTRLTDWVDLHAALIVIDEIRFMEEI